MEAFGPEVTMWLVRSGGVLVGGALGYTYYRFIGCKSGACPLTSNPWISTVYGAFLGGVLAG